MVTLKLDPAKMQFISGFIDTYLNLNAKEKAIFQSELSTMGLEEREKIMQITTSWKEEGRIEGRLEGKLEGKLEEKLNITLRLLKRKFGTLDNQIADRIKSLEPSQLDNLTEDLLDFQSVDDLHNWLSNS